MKIIILLLSFYIQAQATKIKITLNSDTDNLSPIYKDLLKNIYLNAIGISPDIHVFPSSRAIREFDSGNYLAMGARIKEVTELSPRAILIDPPLIDHFVIGVWSIDPAKKLDFKKSTFVGIRGNYLVDYLVKKYSIKNIIYSRNNHNSVNILQHKRAEFIISAEIFLKLDPALKDVNFIKAYSLNTKVHHVISKDLIQYKAKLEKEIARRKQNGDFAIHKLLQKQKKY